jgi:Domain of unknown function (DUF4411)
VLYLIDADVLITAKNKYYAFECVPEFWDWLEHVGRQGHAKLPFEIYDEIRSGRDALADWAKANVNVVLDEELDQKTVARVLDRGYAPDLNDVEIEKLGKDPFLIGYALGFNDRCVVTVEASKPKALRANRKIPDVCTQLGVTCIDTFAFLKALNFTTAWRP